MLQAPTQPQFIGDPAGLLRQLICSDFDGDCSQAISAADQTNDLVGLDVAAAAMHACQTYEQVLLQSDLLKGV